MIANLSHMVKVDGEKAIMPKSYMETHPINAPSEMHFGCLIYNIEIIKRSNYGRRERTKT